MVCNRYVPKAIQREKLLLKRFHETKTVGGKDQNNLSDPDSGIHLVFPSHAQYSSFPKNRHCLSIGRIHLGKHHHVAGYTQKLARRYLSLENEGMEGVAMVVGSWRVKSTNHHQVRFARCLLSLSKPDGLSRIGQGNCAGNP